MPTRARAGVPITDLEDGTIGALTRWAPVDAVEQLRCRDSEGLAQLGDRADARLALRALDLRHMARVEIGFVRHPFLAPTAFLSEPPQVGGEDRQRIAHQHTIPCLSQLYQVQWDSSQR